MAETFYFLGGSLLRLAFTRNRKRDNVKSGVAATLCNRPFPNSYLPPLQSESKGEAFVMVISSTLHMNKKLVRLFL